jgi:hypothetical protein
MAPLPFCRGFHILCQEQIVRLLAGVGSWGSEELCRSDELSQSRIVELA